MTDVKELLERLDALRERATEGPFYVERDESFPSNARADVFRLVAHKSNRARKGTARPVYDATIYGADNADYFSAALNAYPLLRAALLEMREENERLTEALATVQRSGAPGGSILAQRADDHRCGWCRGMYTPCPVQTASEALAKGGRVMAISGSEDIPPCPNCNGEKVIRCGDLPPIECDVCLGTGKDWAEWHRRRQMTKGGG